MINVLKEMKIKISDKRKISVIQKEYGESYPYLRLQFLSRSNQQKKGYDKQSLILGNKTNGDCRKVHNTSSITIMPEMKVSKLEQIFTDECGLYVQVFRTSGCVWLGTTMANDWT